MKSYYLGEALKQRFYDLVFYKLFSTLVIIYCSLLLSTCGTGFYPIFVIMNCFAKLDLSQAFYTFTFHVWTFYSVYYKPVISYLYFKKFFMKIADYLPHFLGQMTRKIFLAKLIVLA